MAQTWAAIQELAISKLAKYTIRNISIIRYLHAEAIHLGTVGNNHSIPGKAQENNCTTPRLFWGYFKDLV